MQLHGNKTLFERYAPALLIITACDALMNGLFIGNMTTHLGTMSFLIMLIVSIVWFVVVKTIYKYAIEDVPQEPKPIREKIVPVIFIVLITILSISTFMSTSYLALPSAKQEWIDQHSKALNDKTSAIITATRRVSSLENVLDTVATNARQMQSAELSKGAVCEAGGGSGRCSTILEGLRNVAANTKNQLVTITSLAERSVARISELQDEIRITASQPESALSFSEKTEQLKGKVALLRDEARTLQELIPISVLTSASDAFTRNFKASSIDPVGSARISQAFHPLGSRLKGEISKLKEAKAITIQNIEAVSDFEMLAHSQTALVAFGIALVLASFPLILISCVLMSIKNDDDTNDIHDTSLKARGLAA